MKRIAFVLTLMVVLIPLLFTYCSAREYERQRLVGLAGVGLKVPVSDPVVLSANDSASPVPRSLPARSTDYAVSPVFVRVIYSVPLVEYGPLLIQDVHHSVVTTREISYCFHAEQGEYGSLSWDIAYPSQTVYTELAHRAVMPENSTWVLWLCGLCGVAVRLAKST